jgi:nucleotide-binding universal stress UspA family protein
MKVFQLYRRILVACGVEPAGLHAFKEIIKYVKNNCARVFALSVVPFHEGDLHLWVFKDIEKEFKKPFEEVLKKVKEISEQEEVIVKTIIEEGEPFSKIVDTALSENCDLIVLGRKKDLGLMRKLLGANVTRVIGYSPVDVLVIPEGSKLAINKILVPMDGSIYSEIAFKKACKIAQNSSSELYLLSVVDVPVEISVQHPDFVEGLYNNAKNILEKAQRTAENLGIKTEVHTREGDPGEKILSFIEEKEIETVVMGSYGRTGIKRLLMGSVAEKVLTFTSVPVLISKNLEI